MNSKCESCLSSRLVISENGYHYICALSPEHALDCERGFISYYVGVKDDNGYEKTTFIPTNEEVI